MNDSQIDKFMEARNPPYMDKDEKYWLWCAKCCSYVTDTGRNRKH